MTGSVAPTHAGGLVYKTGQHGPEFLLVTARRQPQHWVFPKGHIERDESPEQAAVREVYEEAGVRAAIVEAIEDVRLRIADEQQIIRFFLMRAVQDGEPGEGRRSIWLPPVDAMERLSFAEARASLRRAVDAVHKADAI